ncbi:hypothetical protein DQ04_02841010 [Trypanosoma grayi]|uniref:hypothetical protein n=1 Tax=Trypanosoma grayi TaxID=71804 RepID=UPI0004F43662|nr:hypothetical protein DQ04_02841010 [Trypanosoma grayi]KEG11219.1 hypothetical protein DQ04_02841010 [Trypanosoma grayi]
MGQKQSLSDSLHRYVYNHDKEGVAQFLQTHESDMKPGRLEDKVFVELILQQWDSDTVLRFAEAATDDQLAVLVATAVLQNHVVPLAPLFERMENRERVIEQHHLKHLFLTACERENIDAVRVFITNKTYDPSDRRPLRAVVRAQLVKSVVNEELLKMVMSTHPHQADNVEYIRKHCLSDAKSEEVRKIVEDRLFNYIP